MSSCSRTLDDKTIHTAAGRFFGKRHGQGSRGNDCEELRTLEHWGGPSAEIPGIKGDVELLARQRIRHIEFHADRIALGNFGDAKSVGGGVSELRFTFGPGYRVYYTRRGDIVVILLCGGDKGSQEQDIERAKAIAKEIE